MNDLGTPWTKPPVLQKLTVPNTSIKLQNDYGGIINAYSPFIIRPFDSVKVPREIKRGTFEEKCNWPCYAGSNFQQWCSEENAINYFAMRPILEPDTYNSLLSELFRYVVAGSGPAGAVGNLDQEVPWARVFCANTKSDIMAYIMTLVNSAVPRIPKFNKNSSWHTEQFHWTDSDIWQFKTDSGQVFYKCIFNLYNPLRSIGTVVEVTVATTSSGPLRAPNIGPVTGMNFVNQLEWKSSGMSVDGIKSYNEQEGSISLPGSDPTPTTIDWNYGNTLLKQEFNEHGFYEANANITVPGGIPESLKGRVRDYQQNASEYLLPCAVPKFTGIQQNADGSQVYRSQMGSRTSGYPITVLDNPTVVYNVPLVLNKDMTREQRTYPITVPNNIVYT
jgi:hypothetical protein